MRGAAAAAAHGKGMGWSSGWDDALIWCIGWWGWEWEWEWEREAEWWG